jgi:hypothetical protein
VLLSDGRSYTIKLDVYGLPLRKKTPKSWVGKSPPRPYFAVFVGFMRKNEGVGSVPFFVGEL